MMNPETGRVRMPETMWYNECSGNSFQKIQKEIGNMKKLVVLMVAAVLALIACAAAFANDTAVELYDSTMTLLFNHNNLTLDANAEFSLDGKWFKTAEVTLKQDGDRTYRKLHLRSPKKDGTERENGYTIVTEGNDLFLMEDFTPGIYRTGIVGERDSVLRNTVQSQQLTALGRALISQADVLLGKDAITKTADGEYRIVLGENTPAVINSAVNQAVMFAAKRYFLVDYDFFSAGESYSSIANYGTTTQGILFCMRGVSVRKVEISVKADQNGYPVHAEGSIGLYMETAEEGVRQLDITFRADVTDIGDTILKKFDEKEYGVVLAADSTPALGWEAYVPARNEVLEDEMCLQAMDIWRHTGFNMASATSVSCEWNGNYYVVTLSGGDDGINKESYFSEEGQFYFIEAHPNEWFDGVEDLEAYDFEKKLDEKTDKAAQAFFMEFLDNIRYERKNEVKDLQVQWIYEKDGFTYVMYEDKAEEHDGSGVSFLVRISPEMEMRIEDYHPISNG